MAAGQRRRVIIRDSTTIEWSSRSLHAYTVVSPAHSCTLVNVYLYFVSYICAVCGVRYCSSTSGAVERCTCATYSQQLVRRCFSRPPNDRWWFISRTQQHLTRIVNNWNIIVVNWRTKANHHSLVVRWWYYNNDLWSIFAYAHARSVFVKIQTMPVNRRAQWSTVIAVDPAVIGPRTSWINGAYDRPESTMEAPSSKKLWCTVCVHMVKSIPVIFILCILGWSYYAYVYHLCLGKWSFLCMEE